MKNPLTLDQARDAYHRAYSRTDSPPGLPIATHCYTNGSGLWVLRDDRGFLAYVSPQDRVLDHRFQGVAQ